MNNKKVGILRAKRRNYRIQLPKNFISVVRIENEAGNIPFDGFPYSGIKGQFYHSDILPCIIVGNEIIFAMSLSKFFLFRWFQRLYDIIFPKTYLVTYFYKEESLMDKMIPLIDQYNESWRKIQEKIHGTN